MDADREGCGRGDLFERGLHARRVQRSQVGVVVIAADTPTVGLVCVLLVLCIVLSALLPERGSRRPIGDSGAHIANVRPMVRPWDWSRDDVDLADYCPHDPDSVHFAGCGCDE